MHAIGTGSKIASIERRTGRIVAKTAGICAKIAAMCVKTFAMHSTKADGVTAPKMCAMLVKMYATSAKTAGIAMKIDGTAARTAGIAATRVRVTRKRN